MRKIQILGPGCMNCDKLAENARAAVQQLGGDFEVVKVTNLKDIAAFGIMVTPGLAVDGDVKSSGKVLSVDEIRSILSSESI
jgi:small redox-active disulfide protein 2